MDWINDSLLMTETSLRYLMGIACRFFYVVDSEFLENMVYGTNLVLFNLISVVILFFIRFNVNQPATYIVF
jgi:hypothetical protein